MGNNQTTQVENKNKATIIYSNGDRYEGEIVAGKRNGFGSYFYHTGDRYQGMWEQNLKHGLGTMFYKNQEVYEGRWNNNLREGVGTLFLPNGERYYGEWKENKKNGQGIIHMTDGTKFIGHFKNNKKHGICELVGLNKEKVTEEWREGKLNRRFDKTKIVENNDYLKFDSEQLQKYLDSKNALQVETKVAPIKSKYISLEIAKMLRSKNMEENVNIIDSKKNLNQELLLAKPDIFQWSIDEVAYWFKNFDLDKFTDNFINLNIDGNKLLSFELHTLINLIGIKEKNDIQKVTLGFDLLKKIKKETDYTKSIRSIKSFKKPGNEKEKGSGFVNLTSNQLIKSINLNKGIQSIKEVEDINLDNLSFGENQVKEDNEYFDNENEKTQQKKLGLTKQKTYSPCKFFIFI